MPEIKIIKPSKADRDIALVEIDAVISQETALGTKYFEDTYKLKVRAGTALFNLYKSIAPEGDNTTPQTTEFATIKNALDITDTKPFLGKRPLSVVSEDYIAFRANAVTGNAFLTSTVAFTKNGGNGKGKTVATSFRDIAPALRDIVNAANGKATTSNRKGSDEKVANDALTAHNKIVAWNYGHLGAYTGEDENGDKIVWTTSDKNLVRGLINRSGVDMDQLRSISKDDVEFVRALINGVLDDVKRNGPTKLKVIDTEPTDIETKVKGKRTTKAK